MNDVKGQVPIAFLETTKINECNRHLLWKHSPECYSNMDLHKFSQHAHFIICPLSRGFLSHINKTQLLYIHLPNIHQYHSRLYTEHNATLDKNE